MKPRICICCGEPMRDPVNHDSDSPHICVGCSNFFDAPMEPGCLADKSNVPTIQTRPFVFDFSVILTFQAVSNWISTLPRQSKI